MIVTSVVEKVASKWRRISHKVVTLYILAGDEGFMVWSGTNEPNSLIGKDLNADIILSLEDARAAAQHAADAMQRDEIMNSAPELLQ